MSSIGSCLSNDVELIVAEARSNPEVVDKLLLTCPKLAVKYDDKELAEIISPTMKDSGKSQEYRLGIFAACALGRLDVISSEMADQSFRFKQLVCKCFVKNKEISSEILVEAYKSASLAVKRILLFHMCKERRTAALDHIASAALNDPLGTTLLSTFLHGCSGEIVEKTFSKNPALMDDKSFNWPNLVRFHSRVFLRLLEKKLEGIEGRDRGGVWRDWLRHVPTSLLARIDGCTLAVWEIALKFPIKESSKTPEWRNDQEDSCEALVLPTNWFPFFVRHLAGKVAEYFSQNLFWRFDCVVGVSPNQLVEFLCNQTVSFRHKSKVLLSIFNVAGSRLCGANRTFGVLAALNSKLSSCLSSVKFHELQELETFLNELVAFSKSMLNISVDQVLVAIPASKERLVKMSDVPRRVRSSAKAVELLVMRQGFLCKTMIFVDCHQNISSLSSVSAYAESTAIGAFNDFSYWNGIVRSLLDGLRLMTGQGRRKTGSLSFSFPQSLVDSIVNLVEEAVLDGRKVYEAEIRRMLQFYFDLKDAAAAAVSEDFHSGVLLELQTMEGCYRLLRGGRNCSETQFAAGDSLDALLTRRRLHDSLFVDFFSKLTSSQFSADVRKKEAIVSGDTVSKFLQDMAESVAEAIRRTIAGLQTQHYQHVQYPASNRIPTDNAFLRKALFQWDLKWLQDSPVEIDEICREFSHRLVALRDKPIIGQTLTMTAYDNNNLKMKKVIVHDVDVESANLILEANEGKLTKLCPGCYVLQPPSKKQRTVLIENDIDVFIKQISAVPLNNIQGRLAESAWSLSCVDVEKEDGSRLARMGDSIEASRRAFASLLLAPQMRRPDALMQLLHSVSSCVGLDFTDVDNSVSADAFLLMLELEQRVIEMQCEAEYWDFNSHENVFNRRSPKEKFLKLANYLPRAICFNVFCSNAMRFLQAEIASFRAIFDRAMGYFRAAGKCDPDEDGETTRTIIRMALADCQLLPLSLSNCLKGMALAGEDSLIPTVDASSIKNRKNSIQLLLAPLSELLNNKVNSLFEAISGIALQVPLQPFYAHEVKLFHESFEISVATMLWDCVTHVVSQMSTVNDMFRTSFTSKVIGKWIVLASELTTEITRSVDATSEKLQYIERATSLSRFRQGISSRAKHSRQLQDELLVDNLSREDVIRQYPLLAKLPRPREVSLTEFRAATKGLAVAVFESSIQTTVDAVTPGQGADGLNLILQGGESYCSALLLRFGALYAEVGTKHSEQQFVDAVVRVCDELSKYNLGQFFKPFASFVLLLCSSPASWIARIERLIECLDEKNSDGAFLLTALAVPNILEEVTRSSFPSLVHVFQKAATIGTQEMRNEMTKILVYILDESRNNLLSLKDRDDILRFLDIRDKPSRRILQKLADSNSAEIRLFAIERLIDCTKFVKDLSQFTEELFATLKFVATKIRNEAIDNRSAVISFLHGLGEDKWFKGITTSPLCEQIFALLLGIYQDALESPEYLTKYDSSSIRPNFLWWSKLALKYGAVDPLASGKALIEFGMEVQWKDSVYRNGVEVAKEKFSLQFDRSFCKRRFCPVPKQDSLLPIQKEADFVVAVCEGYKKRCEEFFSVTEYLQFNHNRLWPLFEIMGPSLFHLPVMREYFELFANHVVAFADSCTASIHVDIGENELAHRAVVIKDTSEASSSQPVEGVYWAMPSKLISRRSVFLCSLIDFSNPEYSWKAANNPNVHDNRNTRYLFFDSQTSSWVVTTTLELPVEREAILLTSNSNDADVPLCGWHRPSGEEVAVLLAVYQKEEFTRLDSEVGDILEGILQIPDFGCWRQDFAKIFINAAFTVLLRLQSMDFGCSAFPISAKKLAKLWTRYWMLDGEKVNLVDESEVEWFIQKCIQLLQHFPRSLPPSAVSGNMWDDTIRIDMLETFTHRRIGKKRDAPTTSRRNKLPKRKQGMPCRRRRTPVTPSIVKLPRPKASLTDLPRSDTKGCHFEFQRFPLVVEVQKGLVEFSKGIHTEYPPASSGETYIGRILATLNQETKKLEGHWWRNDALVSYGELLMSQLARCPRDCESCLVLPSSPTALNELFGVKFIQTVLRVHSDYFEGMPVRDKQQMKRRFRRPLKSRPDWDKVPLIQEYLDLLLHSNAAMQFFSQWFAFHTAYTQTKQEFHKAKVECIASLVGVSRSAVHLSLVKQFYVRCDNQALRKLLKQQNSLPERNQVIRGPFFGTEDESKLREESEQFSRSLEAFNKKTENGTVALPIDGILAVNIEETLLRGLIKDEERLAPLFFMLQPAFLSTDRARVIVQALPAAAPYLAPGATNRLLALILSGSRRRALKVTVHKEIIRMLARDASPESVAMLVREWFRDEVHRDLRVVLIHTALSFLESSSEVDYLEVAAWKILTSAPTMPSLVHESEVLLQLVTAFCQDDSSVQLVKNIAEKIATKPHTEDVLTRPGRLPKKHMKRYIEEVMLPLCGRVLSLPGLDAENKLRLENMKSGKNNNRGEGKNNASSSDGHKRKLEVSSDKETVGKTKRTSEIDTSVVSMSVELSSEDRFELFREISKEFDHPLTWSLGLSFGLEKLHPQVLLEHQRYLLRRILNVNVAMKDRIRAAIQWTRLPTTNFLEVIDLLEYLTPPPQEMAPKPEKTEGSANAAKPKGDQSLSKSETPMEVEAVDLIDEGDYVGKERVDDDIAAIAMMTVHMGIQDGNFDELLLVQPLANFLSDCRPVYLCNPNSKTRSILKERWTLAHTALLRVAIQEKSAENATSPMWKTYIETMQILHTRYSSLCGRSDQSAQEQRLEICQRITSMIDHIPMFSSRCTLLPEYIVSLEQHLKRHGLTPSTAFLMLRQLDEIPLVGSKAVLKFASMLPIMTRSELDWYLERVWYCLPAVDITNYLKWMMDPSNPSLPYAVEKFFNFALSSDSHQSAATRLELLKSFWCNTDGMKGWDIYVQWQPIKDSLVLYLASVASNDRDSTTGAAALTVQSAIELCQSLLLRIPRSHVVDILTDVLTETRKSEGVGFKVEYLAWVVASLDVLKGQNFDSTYDSLERLCKLLFPIANRDGLLLTTCGDRFLLGQLSDGIVSLANTLAKCSNRTSEASKLLMRLFVEDTPLARTCSLKMIQNDAITNLVLCCLGNQWTVVQNSIIRCIMEQLKSQSLCDAVQLDKAKRIGDGLSNQYSVQEMMKHILQTAKSANCWKSLRKSGPKAEELRRMLSERRMSDGSADVIHPILTLFDHRFVSGAKLYIALKKLSETTAGIPHGGSFRLLGPGGFPEELRFTGQTPLELSGFLMSMNMLELHETWDFLVWGASNSLLESLFQVLLSLDNALGSNFVESSLKKVYSASLRSKTAKATSKAATDEFVVVDSEEFLLVDSLLEAVSDVVVPPPPPSSVKLPSNVVVVRSILVSLLNSINSGLPVMQYIPVTAPSSVQYQVAFRYKVLRSLSSADNLAILSAIIPDYIVPQLFSVLRNLEIQGAMFAAANSTNLTSSSLTLAVRGWDIGRSIVGMWKSVGASSANESLGRLLLPQLGLHMQYDPVVTTKMEVLHVNAVIEAVWEQEPRILVGVCLGSNGQVSLFDVILHWTKFESFKKNLSKVGAVMSSLLTPAMQKESNAVWLFAQQTAINLISWCINRCQEDGVLGYMDSPAHNLFRDLVSSEDVHRSCSSLRVENGFDYSTYAHVVTCGEMLNFMFGSINAAQLRRSLIDCPLASDFADVKSLTLLSQDSKTKTSGKMKSSVCSAERISNGIQSLCERVASPSVCLTQRYLIGVTVFTVDRDFLALACSKHEWIVPMDDSANARYSKRISANRIWSLLRCAALHAVLSNQVDCFDNVLKSINFALSNVTVPLDFANVIRRVWQLVQNNFAEASLVGIHPTSYRIYLVQLTARFIASVGATTMQESSSGGLKGKVWVPELWCLKDEVTDWVRRLISDESTTHSSSLSYSLRDTLSALQTIQSIGKE